MVATDVENLLCIVADFSIGDLVLYENEERSREMEVEVDCRADGCTVADYLR